MATAGSHLQKITTHLWYDNQAAEAAEFYASAFKDAGIRNKTTIHNTPTGDAETVSMEIFGRDSRSSAAARCLNSIPPYRSWLPAISRTRSTSCGASSPPVAPP